MGAKFVKLSDELVLNVNEIQMIRRHGAGGNVWLRYLMHTVMLTESEYAGLVQLVDWGLQSEPHQEAGQPPAGSDQSFADWAVCLGMYVENDKPHVATAVAALRLIKFWCVEPGGINITSKDRHGKVHDVAYNASRETARQYLVDLGFIKE